MATRKQKPMPLCKRLDLDVMTNREVRSELTRIYGNLVDRISAYCDVLGIDDEADTETGLHPDLDSVYDEAQGLVSRIERITYVFERGVWSNDQRARLRFKNGGTWNWGLSEFKHRLEEHAVESLVEEASGA